MSKLHIISKPSTQVTLSNALSFTALNQLLCDVAPLYPNFDVWLNFTFRRNLSSGERQILIAHNGDDLLGCALLKSTPAESKICTFYVAEFARGQGIGQQLMNESLATLDNLNNANRLNNSETIITVSDDRHADLFPLLHSTGFSLQQKLDAHYRPAHSEFVYSL